MRHWIAGGVFWLVCVGLSGHSVGQLAGNLLEDPSFETPKAPDQFGLVFAKWGGWKYEGDCRFAVGEVAHTGRHSCLLVGGAGAKIRTAQLRDLEPGRYQITAWLRGLDIGTGSGYASTEFMFNDKYMPLNKNGTFGWTKLNYVADLQQKKQAGPSFGMLATGYLWIDDVSLVKVGPEVPLTNEPVLGPEETPIGPPGKLTAEAVRCPLCAYRNLTSWTKCYACGSLLRSQPVVAGGSPVKSIASFETKNPFSGGRVVEQHATDGKKALRIDRNYASLDGPQDWSGYDFLKADLHVASDDPLELSVEVRDVATLDYWTRVNYTTVAPPGQSTLVIPLKQLYVGEKSRPGRVLKLDSIRRLVFSVGQEPKAPLFLDNVRLERDTATEKVAFDGLFAFDFGPDGSPLMDGFQAITPGTTYSPGRGYGLKDARVWRSFDALQPDPLYQDFMCIERGGLAVDVPNGRYRVFVNIDSPSGYWGEYQAYRQRSVLAEGQPVVTEEMDFGQFQRKYFRFWNVEDQPSDNTFDKYQKAYFEEKVFDVDVTDKQLNLEFQGENWGCCVSAAVIFPVAQAAAGEAFLKHVEQKRRFYFDNYFKRTLHRPVGSPLKPDAEDHRRGYVLFQRDYMQDVYYNDTPRSEEIGGPLRGEAFAGELEPLTLGLVPLRDLGQVTVTPSDLRGPAGSIPAQSIQVGFVSYRISRVTLEGSVYTIGPRLIMPHDAVAMPKDVTRRIWLTVRTPRDAKPGLYRGVLSIQPEQGGPAEVPVEFRVRAGTLDPVDVPAGPFGCSIATPWSGDDPAAASWNQAMLEHSLRKLREYGFTTCSGLPSIVYRGFRDGQPLLDFAAADSQMRLAKDLGFLAMVTYGGGVSGFHAYHQDAQAMQAAGFQDYSEFVKRIYTAVQQHATAQDWIPVYYNLADEPMGDDMSRSIENATAYRKAFPQGPPRFTGASSFIGSNRADGRFLLARALHVANWNIHDEDAVNLLHKVGGDWAFYNGCNRWTFGDYMYKAAKQFRMQFRIDWHWNLVAGDPYYGLDCREDDYAWCNSSPDGQLIPAVQFERLREGLDDYRRLLTAARLAKEQTRTPAARAAEALIAKRLAAFKLGQRDHDALFRADDWGTFRRQMGEAIESLRK